MASNSPTSTPGSFPSLADLIAQITGTLQSRLSADYLRYNDIPIFAYAAAGVFDTFFDRLSWVYRQSFAQLCDDDTILTVFAPQYGLSLDPATSATATCQFTAQAGASLPQGAKIMVGSLTFSTIADAFESGGSITVEATADTPGSTGLSPTTCNLMNVTAGITTQGTITHFGDGDNQETVASLRARVLDETRNPDNGGTASDFEKWALSYLPATRAKCIPLIAGPGTVGVTFVCDGRQNITPTIDDMNAVHAIIEAKKYVTATFQVVSPTITKIDMTLKISPDTTENRAAAEASLQEMINAKTFGSTIYLSDIYFALAYIAADHCDVVAPTTDTSLADTTIAVLGEVTYA